MENVTKIRLLLFKYETNVFINTWSTTATHMPVLALQKWGHATIGNATGLQTDDDETLGQIIFKGAGRAPDLKSNARSEPYIL